MTNSDTEDMKRCATCDSLILSTDYVQVDDEYFEPNCFEAEKYKMMRSINDQLDLEGKALGQLVRFSMDTLDQLNALSQISSLLGKLNTNIETLTTALTETKTSRSRKTVSKS